jgi:hypothetical protein
MVKEKPWRNTIRKYGSKKESNTTPNQIPKMNSGAPEETAIPAHSENLVRSYN